MSAIRRVASGILAEKMADAAAVQADSEAKRDIMSLLVRARVAAQRESEKQAKGGTTTATATGQAYGMNDEAMMDQVVRVPFTGPCGEGPSADGGVPALVVDLPWCGT